MTIMNIFNYKTYSEVLDMVKIMQVKEETHKDLRMFVAKNELRSFDDAIRRLLENVDSRSDC